MEGVIFDFVSVDRRDIVLEAIRDHPGITAVEIAELTGIRNEKVRQIARSLEKYNLMEIRLRDRRDAKRNRRALTDYWPAEKKETE